MQLDALARAHLSLDGLSVGDAFGEHAARTGRDPALAEPRWRWTDDTAMALAIVEGLARHGAIREAELADAFAERYHREPWRGYGRGAHRILEALHAGQPYPVAARLVFDGAGSCGNGGGMRAAPIGAYFADDLPAAIEHAQRSAAPTHAHPDGAAGAVAIAVAAARVFAGERDPRALIDTVARQTPPGPTRDGLQRAAGLLDAGPVAAALALGNGSHVLSSDTVPFAVWCAATHVTDYAAALEACALVGGDIDTTCAMVGGVVVGAVGREGIPPAWRAAREPLPDGIGDRPAVRHGV